MRRRRLTRRSTAIEAERAAAESDASSRPYFDLGKLRPYARPFYAKMLPLWDGGAVTIAGTIAEGDAIADFRVIELPGHAPGLIGLLRESDRLALVSDTVYTLDIQTGKRNRPTPRIPHPAFDQSTEQAAASIAKLAELEPAIVWAGHCDPVTGDVVAQLLPPPRRRPDDHGQAQPAAHQARRADQRIRRRRRQRADAARRAGPGARREYADTLAGGLHREDALARATELLFERLAVSWTITGVPITRQRELLGRYRMAIEAERAFVRESLREHLDEHFPELRAP